MACACSRKSRAMYTYIGPTGTATGLTLDQARDMRRDAGNQGTIRQG